MDIKLPNNGVKFAVFKITYVQKYFFALLESFNKATTLDNLMI